MTGEPVVDGYAHCGLSKFLPVADLVAAMRLAPVSRALVVQHFGEYDNYYLASIIWQDPGTFAGIALIDPFGDDWQDRIADVVTLGFRGLRFNVEWLRTKMHVALAAASSGLSLMIYVPESMSGAVPLIRDLARRAPDRAVVVSHLGAPRVNGSTLTEGMELLELAGEPNVSTTLSGLGMYVAHPHCELTGLVTAVVGEFGPRRVMWGSNFPVGLDAEGYGDDLDMILEGRWDLDSSAIAGIVGGTAARLWFESV